MPEPNKMTVYDPNNPLRTTIKETNIHNRTTNNMNSNVNKLTVYNPDEILRTTIKETTIHDTTVNNLTGNKRIIAYDPDDIAKTTMKETAVHNSRNNLTSTVPTFPKETALFLPSFSISDTKKGTRILS